MKRRAPSAKKQIKSIKFCFVLSDEEKRKLSELARRNGRSMGNYLCAVIASRYAEKFGG